MSIVSHFFLIFFSLIKNMGDVSVFNQNAFTKQVTNDWIKEYIKKTNEMMMNKWMEYDLREWMSSIQVRLSIFCKEYLKVPMHYQLKID